MQPEVKVDVRERLIDAAAELFYGTGLRSVSVDRVIELAGTTKVSFYRHFKSKDDLVVLYLQRFAASEREAIGAAVEQAPRDPDQALLSVAGLIGGMACQPGFRGCPFINAAAEYPDPQHKVRVAVREHRAWCLSAFEDLAAAVDSSRRIDAGRDLMLLRDGAMVAGYLDDTAAPGEAFLRSGRAVLARG